MATSESGFFIYLFCIKSNFRTKYVKSFCILGHWLEQELFCLNKRNAANLFTTAFAFGYHYEMIKLYARVELHVFIVEMPQGQKNPIHGFNGNKHDQGMH